MNIESITELKNVDVYFYKFQTKFINQYKIFAVCSNSRENARKYMENLNKQYTNFIKKEITEIKKLDLREITDYRRFREITFRIDFDGFVKDEEKI